MSRQSVEVRGPEALLKDLRARASRADQAGRQLPSVRELMKRYRVSPVTVERVLGQLSREGRIVTKPGRGSYVAEPNSVVHSAPDFGWQSLALGPQPHGAEVLLDLMGEHPPDMVLLGSGYADESLQPVTALAAAASRAARRPQVWGKAPAEGLESLRSWFAREVGGSVHTRDVLVVPGGQAALSTIFRGLLSPGAPLLVESPTWLGALAVARAASLNVVPVPVDSQGVLPDALQHAFKTSGARAFYSQPTYQNPTGAVLAADRRAAVLDAVRSAGAFLIEDDFARDLVIEGPVPGPLVREDDGHVIYVRSLTKSVAPGLRIAAICARGPVALRLRAARVVDDLFVSGPMQEIALELVTSPTWPRHLKSLRTALKERRDTLIASLRKHLPWFEVPLVPKGSFTLWVRLPANTQEHDLVARASQLGVWLNPGRHWFPAEPTGPHLRFSFAATPAPLIAEGIRRLSPLRP
jgi:DNA-binding transcriptional MocR family regulator